MVLENAGTFYRREIDEHRRIFPPCGYNSSSVVAVDPSPASAGLKHACIVLRRQRLDVRKGEEEEEEGEENVMKRAGLIISDSAHECPQWGKNSSAHMSS